jgi:TrmH family RNA methyltransferase
LADPGNLGVLLRTAWATGIEAVLTWGGVDPLHPKVVRASAGAVFHVPCQRIDSIPDYPLIGMSPRAPLSLYEVEWPQRFALVVGNEAHGLSQELTERLHFSLSVPMQPGCESLNAATSAAVVLFEWRRLAHRS